MQKHAKAKILIVFLAFTLLSFFNVLSFKQVQANPYEALTISGRYWVNSTGDPVLLRGVCYPHHENGALWSNYDSAEIESNLTEIASYGFNLVVIQVAMDVFESTRGVYSGAHWDNLQDMLTRLKNKDMYAMLRTPDYCSASSGWVNNIWDKTNWWWGNQTFRDDQAYFLKNLTYTIWNTWSLHECVVGLDLWAEADCDTSTKRNFIGYWETGSGVNTTALQTNGNASWKAWLENRYGTINALNATWTPAKYNSTLAGWEDSFAKIGVPSTVHLDQKFSARKADYNMWMLETWYNITEMRKDACKTYYNFPVGGSVSGYIWRTQSTPDWKPKQFLEESHIADLLDIIMVDSYGIMSGDFQTLGTYHRRWNKPMMGIEYGIKTTDYTLSEQKEFWTEAYGSMLTQGIGASAIWCWMDNSATYGYGLTEVDGDNKAILDFLNDTNQLVQTIQGELDQLLFDDEIAIVMSQTTIHKIGRMYGYNGFFSIAPIEFARMNIYPTVVYEGTDRTAWDRTILKADNLTTLNDYKILVWQPIDASFQWNSTWWNQTFVQTTAGRIIMGLACCATGEFQDCSDDYGWSINGVLNLTMLPYPTKRTYGAVGVTAYWNTNASCLWGSYAGEDVNWYAFGSTVTITDPDTLNLEGDATHIVNLTIAEKEYYAVVANSEVYMNLLPVVQNFRFWHPINNTGTIDMRESEDYNCTILRTGLEWFNYTARFNSTNPYVRINIMNASASKYAVFSNPMNTSQSLTWKLNNLTDYNLTGVTNYTLSWIHNSTTLGNYTGNQLQSGLDFTIENQTIGILKITLAEAEGNGNGNGNGTFQTHEHSTSALIYGTDFAILFPYGSSLSFQSDNTIKIEVITGLWNSSNTSSVTVWNDRGSLKFTATNNSLLEISSPDAEEGFDISITGATSTSTLGNFTYRSTIQTGDIVTITWAWRLESWIDKYFLFGIGMSGLIMMIAAPTWLALGYLKKGIDIDTIEQFSWVFLFMIIGFGLFVSWLWW